MPVTEETERNPTLTDYLAAATLSYGIIFMWLRISSWVELPWVVAYLFYYAAGLGPTYLVCRRVTRNQFPVAMISAIVSWIFTLVCLIAFTQGDPMGFFKALLVMFLLGGLTTSIITMRKRLRPGDDEG